MNIQNNLKRNNILPENSESGEKISRSKCMFCHQLQRQREYCNLAVIFVAQHFNVPIRQLMSKTRAKAKVARARQIAIYVAHTTFSVPYREAAAYFQRDRTTIAHACKTIEDQRDDQHSDKKIAQIENLVEEAAGLRVGFQFELSQKSVSYQTCPEFGI